MRGLATYDPGFLNTAACRSAISYIDGDKGILRYRGYPIEQLAERSTFLETAYLLLHGELPSAAELDSWVFSVTHHHDRPREHQEIHRRVPSRCPSHGDVREHRRRALDLLSRSEADRERDVALDRSSG